MAGQRLPFFVMIGPSNMNGTGSVLTDYPAADLARVIGLPLFPSTTPATVTVPGIKMWQAKLPFATSSVRNITDVPATNQVEVDGAGFAATDVGKWVYIATNTTGQGQARRISAQGTAVGGQPLLTVSPAWTGTLSADGTIRIITGSRSVGALAVLTGQIADANGSTSTIVDAARAEADDTWVGFSVRFTAGTAANIGLLRTITNFDAASDTITFSPALPQANVAGDTYEILQSTTAVVKDGTSSEFTGADVGRWVSVAGQFRKITAVKTIVGTTTGILLHKPLTIAQALNDPIYVLDGATVADTLVNFAQGAAFRDMQWFLDTAPVFFTGFDYSNYRQNAPASPETTAAGTLVNCVPELMTQLRYRFKDTVYGFTIGVDSAQAAPLYIGDSLQTVTFAWRHDLTHLDYHPSNTAGILAAVLTGIASAQALATAQGDTLDPQGIFFVGLLENDTLDVQKLAHLGENVALIRDKVRTALGNEKVPCIILGCSPSSVILANHDEDADRASANEQALQLKQDDPWTGFVPTPNAAFIKHSDQIHYLPAGHVAIAQALAEEWDEVKRRATAASRRAAELPTLASLRTRVKRRYERSAVGNDATNAQVDTFINDSLREIYNTLGDNAWFLRLVEEIDALAAFPNTVELPRSVRRFLKLELKSCPGQSLVVKGLAYTDEGRTQVTLHTCATGPFICHFIQDPKELVVDTDVALVPSEYQELVVMLTCKRLTENAGNGTLAIYYASETERLWRMLKREALRYDRMRQGQLQGTGAYDSQRNSGWPGWQENL